MSFDKFDVLLKVVAVLDKLSITYMIGGSFASSFYGWSRSTNDVDILAAIKPEQAGRLFQELEADFYVSEQAIHRAVHGGPHFNAIHVDTAFKVDVFIAKPGFPEHQLTRRRLWALTQTLEQKAYIASPEDIVLAKLDWYRRGNEVSEMQWRDVLNVIKVQGDSLDFNYMRQWAKELGVADLLEQAISEAKKLQ